MNKMVLALVAICVVGFASAVTIDWDKATWTTLISDTSISDGWSHTYERDGSFTVRVTYTGTTKDSVSGWNRVLKIAAGNAWYEFQSTETSGIYAAASPDGGANADFSGSIETIKFATGTEVDISLIFVYNGDSKALTYYAVDNLTSTTEKILEVSDITLTDTVTFAAGTGVDTDRALTKIFDSGSATYTLEVSPVALPEPTVMALLALGVAGLALRRKAV